MLTFFELYLQRRHNEMSLKPIPQIVLGDKEKRLFVLVQNNGVGPLIIQRLLFFSGEIQSVRINEFLNLPPKSYNHDTENFADNPKVLLPGAQLEVFGTVFEDHEGEAEIDHVRTQLAKLRMIVECRDVYNKRISVERCFKWFARHQPQHPD